jgi:hypothetical protein
VTDSPGRDGVSFCEYGDEPNLNLISVSSILLLDIPPTAQRAQHKTARQAALAAADMCVTGSLRELGPTGGVGSFAAFCVSTPGSVRGGWVQKEDVFSLSYFTPSDAQGSVADRLARFQAIAAAVSPQHRIGSSYGRWHLSMTSLTSPERPLCRRWCVARRRRERPSTRCSAGSIRLRRD